MTKNYQNANSVLNYFNNKLGVNYNIEINFLFNDEFRKLNSNKDYYIKEENDKYIVFVNLISKQYGKYCFLLNIIKPLAEIYVYENNYKTKMANLTDSQNNIIKQHINLKSSVKKVTVMSCNISNNLQISDEMPPEKYVELINNVFNEIEQIIFKYNGTINRFVGNSVLVYWGYPIHSRKDSENAIKAGIEIIRKIDEYNLSLNKIDFDEYDEQTFEEKNPKNFEKTFDFSYMV